MFVLASAVSLVGGMVYQAFGSVEMEPWAKVEEEEEEEEEEEMGEMGGKEDKEEEEGRQPNVDVNSV